MKSAKQAVVVLISNLGQSTDSRNEKRRVGSRTNEHIDHDEYTHFSSSFTPAETATPVGEFTTTSQGECKQTRIEPGTEPL